MTPIETKHTATILGAPANWNAERLGPCRRLPVAVGDGFTCSYWRASWKERVAILLGRPVRLCVAGPIQPPVWVDTELV
jgi:hypothetical protein